MSVLDLHHWGHFSVEGEVEGDLGIPDVGFDSARLVRWMYDYDHWSGSRGASCGVLHLEVLRSKHEGDSWSLRGEGCDHVKFNANTFRGATFIFRDFGGSDAVLIGLLLAA